MSTFTQISRHVPNQNMNSMSKARMTAFAILVLLFAVRTSDAKTPLGRTWKTSQLQSMDEIDHSLFDSLLKKYVDADGYVDYTRWHGSAEDRRRLKEYLSQLSQASAAVLADRSAKLAFWINAYNALTLEGILQEYPTTSIRNHTAKVVGYNIWRDLPLRVGNVEYSLDQIEHKVLRKMDEPRIHFAIVCASVGCPRLRNESYQPDRLGEQLSDNTLDFFSRRQNFRVSSDGRTLYMSKILDWFGDDFGSSQDRRMRYLAPYLPKSAREAAVDPRTRIRYLDYNWSLNDQKAKTPPALK